MPQRTPILLPEGAPAGRISRLLDDNGFGVLVGTVAAFVLGSLAAAGIISMGLAIALLAVAFVVGAAMPFFSGPKWFRSRWSKIVTPCVMAALVFAIFLYERAHFQPAAVPMTAPQQPLAPPPTINLNQGSAGVNGTVNGTVNIYAPAEQKAPLEHKKKAGGVPSQSSVRPRTGKSTLPGPVPHFHAPAAPPISADELYRRASLARDIRGDFFLAHRDADPLDPEQVTYINDTLRARGESWQITAENAQQMLLSPLISNITGTGGGTGVALHNSGGAIIQHVEMHGDKDAKGVDAYDSPDTNISDVKVFAGNAVPAQPAPAPPVSAPQSMPDEQMHQGAVRVGSCLNCPSDHSCIDNSEVYNSPKGISYPCDAKICIIDSKIHDHSIIDIDVRDCRK